MRRDFESGRRDGETSVAAIAPPSRFSLQVSSDGRITLGFLYFSCCLQENAVTGLLERPRKGPGDSEFVADALASMSARFCRRGITSRRRRLLRDDVHGDLFRGDGRRADPVIGGGED